MPHKTWRQIYIYVKHFDCRILAIIEKSKTVLVAPTNLVYHFSQWSFFFSSSSSSSFFSVVSMEWTVFAIFFEHWLNKRGTQVIGSLLSQCRTFSVLVVVSWSNFLCAFLPIFIEHLMWKCHTKSIWLCVCLCVCVWQIFQGSFWHWAEPLIFPFKL